MDIGTKRKKFGAQINVFLEGWKTPNTKKTAQVTWAGLCTKRSP